ncbi:hypothetical protein DSO57_1038441 [Entomophthora muscae]|uniref:Uncharacterized protein n=1 Tax=Entomophthora muscae TaxID=34485 RepID=A0ACC2SNI3_9FUNG|nr:hypothetical protein DSO57_1038441 [Entomophthora muscae]
MLFLSFLLLSNSIFCAQLYRIEGRITPSEKFPVLETFGQSSRVFLDNGVLSGLIQQNGRFIIHDVPSGNFTLKVVTDRYKFPLLRADVGLDSKRKVIIHSMRLGTPLEASGPEVAYPLRISPVEQIEYFDKREGFNIMSILSNPMMLMSMVSLALVFIAPKMLSNLDEETLKEVQETQSTMNSFLTGSQMQEGPSFSERLATMMAEK